jgi:hypothetical protein
MHITSNASASSRKEWVRSLLTFWHQRSDRSSRTCSAGGGERTELGRGPPRESSNSPFSVPGTGRVDSAKSFDDADGSWWIVREIPLEPPKSRRQSNEKGNVTLR